MSYRDELRDPRWQKKRLQIMQRDGWKCRRCHDEKSPLNVHHFKYRPGAMPWEYEDGELVTLCEGCHEREHHEKPNERNLSPWPLLKVGDEKFFGYVIGVGFDYQQDESDPLYAYASFAYGNEVTIVELPPDGPLFAELAKYAASNHESQLQGAGIYGKVWIEKLEVGYRVDLP